MTAVRHGKILTTARLVLWLMVEPALAQQVLITGIGRMSCAHWLSQSVNEGEGWILGYWSGLNFANARTVGQHTDGEGIITEVRKACATRLEEAFEERAAIFYRTGDSKPAEVFERLAATAANVPAVLMGQQQKLWDADPKAVARVWENVLNEIAWGDFRPEDSSGLDAADVVAELCRRAGRTQAS